MSDIFFTDSSEVPLPPEEVRILELSAVPRPDGQRIIVAIEITPFQVKPNVELKILDAEGHERATLSVVEAIDRKMDFTMHLRTQNNSGDYQLFGRVFYADIEQYGAEEGQQAQSSQILEEASRDIDSRTIDFSIS